MRFRENMRKYSELILQKMHRILLLMALMLLSAMTLGTTSWAKEVVDLKTVVLGNSHGCGITHGGALRCFGNNGAGQLGIDQKLPYSFARHGLTVLPSGVSNVAISDDHTCALVSNSLYCWGSNTYGQLGTGKSGENIRTPTQVFAMSAAVTAIAAGGSTTCAILTPNGTLQCWGRNDLGQVGNGTVSPMVLAPFTVIPSGATAVAVGAQHACAVVDGGLQCWGFLLFKDEGLKTLNRPTSIIAPGQGVTAVAAALHTCVIVKGALQCWGRNFHGQIGVPAGARIALGVPTTIVASGVNAMALSNENTCLSHMERSSVGDGTTMPSWVLSPPPAAPRPLPFRCLARHPLLSAALPSGCDRSACLRASQRTPLEIFCNAPIAHPIQTTLTIPRQLCRRRSGWSLAPRVSVSPNLHLS